MIFKPPVPLKGELRKYRIYLFENFLTGN